MIATILLISMILHISAFIMIYKLMKKINNQNSATPHEISELLDLYLEEIKAENKELKADIQTYERKKERFKQIEKVEEVKTPKRSTSQIPVQEDIKQTEDFPIHYEEAEDYVEASNEAKMLNLYHQGYQPEEIARKLNAGKTEVELILKFHNKK